MRADRRSARSVNNLSTNLVTQIHAVVSLDHVRILLPDGKSIYNFKVVAAIVPLELALPLPKSPPSLSRCTPNGASEGRWTMIIFEFKKELRYLAILVACIAWLQNKRQRLNDVAQQ